MIYDPYSRQMQEDPYPTYRYFRDEEPCTHNPKMGFYALFRFEDVWEATLDWKTYGSSLGPILENKGEIPGEVMSIIGMDPPRHVRIRNLVSKGFTPRTIASGPASTSKTVEGQPSGQYPATWRAASMLSQ